MADLDALRRAVCARPDDDTPRLVFADLAEDLGEHRLAHFVRTQVELAKVPADDPLHAKCRQLEPDVFRGWNLSDHLPKPLPDGFSVSGFQFRRGFAWRVTALSAEAVAARAAALLALAPVQALSFDHLHRPDLAVLAAAPALTRFRRLEFSQCHFNGLHLLPLVESKYAADLDELRFDDGAVTADGLEAMAGSALFGRLTAVGLRNNALPPALLVDALAAAPADAALRRLDLSQADLPAPDAATLFALPLVRNLDHLDLSENPLGVDGVTALAEARGLLRGLRVLKLSKTLPGVPGVAALAKTSALAGVRWLDLSNNRLGPVAVRTLADGRNARGLRVLDLSGNPVGDKGAVVVAGSRHLAGLVDLDLQDAGVGDAGMMALADSPHLDGLLRLDLRDRLTGRPPGEEARRALLDRFGPRVSFNRG